MAACKRVLRYLQGTAELGITYSRGSAGGGGEIITGYSDSDWAGEPETRRSTTGFVFMISGGAVSWASRLQPTVALSSTEAEYMAACAATQEAVYFRQLLGDLGCGVSGPTVIYVDNQGAIALGENPVRHKRSKHIEVRYHYVRERVARGDTRLQYISTVEQLADLFTKALPVHTVVRLRAGVMGQHGEPAELGGGVALSGRGGPA
jgi:hypothetical protein